MLLLGSMRIVRQEEDLFRGATIFAKGLRHTIVSAWGRPKNTTIKIILRGGNSQGFTNGPLLKEVKTGKTQQTEITGRPYVCSLVPTFLIWRQTIVWTYHRCMRCINPQGVFTSIEHSKQSGTRP